MAEAVFFDAVLSSDLPWLATFALSKIGLRQPALDHAQINSTAHGSEPTQHWKKTRAWYQEVKAGKRTFSFVGQKVEYRFKPDGTWDTIALANADIDAIIEPVAPPATPANVAAVLANPNNTAAKESPWWTWLIGALLVVTASIAWRIAMTRRKQTST